MAVQRNSSIMRELHTEVHCSVCMELFTNPQALPCLHTFCHNCTLQLIHYGKVVCPTCRKQARTENILADFKTKHIVEIYKRRNLLNSKSNLRGHSRKDNHVTQNGQCESGDSCGLCEEKLLEYYCQNCDRLLCKSCQKAHTKISNCEPDDAQKLSRNQTQQPVERLTTLTKEMEEVQWQLIKRKEVVVDITKKSAESCLEELQKAERKTMEDVQKWYAKERKIMFEKKDKKLLEVDVQCKQLVDLATQVIQYFSEIKDSPDAWLDTADCLEEHITQELKKLKEETFSPVKFTIKNLTASPFSYSAMTMDKDSSVIDLETLYNTTVRRGRTLSALVDPTISHDYNDSPRLSNIPDGPDSEAGEGSSTNRRSYERSSSDTDPKIVANEEGTVSNSAEVRVVSRPGSAGDNLSSTFSLGSMASSETVTFQRHGSCEDITQLQTVGGEIWALKLDHIDILSYDGTLKKILRPAFTGARDLCVSGSGHVIVATHDMGLLQLSAESGEILHQIQSGQFWSVCRSGQRHVWSVKQEGSVITLHNFRISENSCEHVQRVETNISPENCSVFCTVLGQKLYITSSKSNRVFEIASTGGRVISVPSREGQPFAEGTFNCPRTVYSDGCSGILVTDYYNNRLQVYSHQTQMWSVVEANEEVTRPAAAAIDSQNRIWVVAGGFGSQYLCRSDQLH